MAIPAITRISHVGFGRLHDHAETQSLNAGSGPDRIVYAVGMGIGYINSATYDSVGMSYYFQNEYGSLTCAFLVEPSAGSNSLSLGMTDAGTAIGCSYQNVDPVLPHQDIQLEDNSGETTHAVVKLTETVLTGVGSGFISDTHTLSATYGTPTEFAGSERTGGGAVKLNLGELVDAWGPGANTVDWTQGGHVVDSFSMLLNPIPARAGQVIIAAIQRRERQIRQFWHEWKSPHLGWDYELWKPQVLFPSRLRTDLDRHIVDKRYTELVLGQTP
jgi:hypothetical protein